MLRCSVFSILRTQRQQKEKSEIDLFAKGGSTCGCLAHVVDHFNMRTNRIINRAGFCRNFRDPDRHNIDSCADHFEDLDVHAHSTLGPIETFDYLLNLA